MIMAIMTVICLELHSSYSRNEVLGANEIVLHYFRVPFANNSKDNSDFIFLVVYLLQLQK